MILFRVDANEILATGHVMRCLSIAGEFRVRGEECGFVTADSKAESLIKGWGFRQYVLDTDWRNPDQEIPVFAKICENLNPGMVIVDHYHATGFYIGKIKEFTKVVYIDDLNVFYNPADVIINYNIYAESMDYKDKYRGARVKLLLGTQYVPLRSEFQKVEGKEIHEKVKDIFVSTGGADPANIGIGIMDAIISDREWDGLNFHFILGVMNPYKERMMMAAAKNKNVFIHSNVKRMDLIMKQCDIAVSAAGSTLYELCSCGIPTVTYILADNQIDGAREFAARGLMLNVGDCREGGDFIGAILKSLSCLCGDKEKRTGMSRRMQETVDGKGVVHLVDAVYKMLSDKVCG